MFFVSQESQTLPCTSPSQAQVPYTMQPGKSTACDLVCEFNSPLPPVPPPPSGGQITLQWSIGGAPQTPIDRPFSFDWVSATTTYTPSRCVTVTDTYKDSPAPINVPSPAGDVCYPVGTTQPMEVEFKYQVTLTFADSCPAAGPTGLPIQKTSVLIKPNAELCYVNKADLFYSQAGGASTPGPSYDTSVTLMGCCKVTHVAKGTKCTPKRCPPRSYSRIDRTTGVCKCNPGYIRRNPTDVACAKCGRGAVDNAAGTDCTCKPGYGNLNFDNKGGCQRCGRKGVVC
jgi:hypothetical protein